ncbi:hypothetical protein GCM10009662_27930 [Catellatospora coxensis]|uniref:Uncharacterized protein n=1 Tax=Catellatospora coxensis TaxID=310354 RepID=A0A8J3PB96_9ACTN|nr:hypothetical protein Cco03nite_53810 [Catellatospora coxensis]
MMEGGPSAHAGTMREWLRELRKDDPDFYCSVNLAIDMLA